MGAAVIKLSDHVSRPRRRRHNDPLESPLVRHTRAAIQKTMQKVADAHLETTSTEGAIATGGYLQGMADALKLLEWVAVELAKRPTP